VLLPAETPFVALGCLIKKQRHPGHQVITPICQVNSCKFTSDYVDAMAVLLQGDERRGACAEGEPARLGGLN
jgi:hypothetical protein